MSDEWLAPLLCAGVGLALVWLMAQGGWDNE